MPLTKSKSKTKIHAKRRKSASVHPVGGKSQVTAKDFKPNKTTEKRKEELTRAELLSNIFSCCNIAGDHESYGSKNCTDECIKCKELQLLEVLFKNPETRKAVQRQVEAAKKELKRRLEMELPRKFNYATIPNTGMYKKFGSKLQVQDFDASAAFAKSLNDVFETYREEIDIETLEKLL